MFKWVDTILDLYRWISAQLLPRHLAEFQWRFNRRFDLESILERLSRAATLTPAMPQSLLVLAEVGR